MNKTRVFVGNGLVKGVSLAIFFLGGIFLSSPGRVLAPPSFGWWLAGLAILNILGLAALTQSEKPVKPEVQEKS